MSVEQS